LRSSVPGGGIKRDVCGSAILKLIVDKNVLEDDSLADFLAEDTTHYAVICGYAGLESYTGNALVNITRSMRVLSRFPRQVLILKSGYALSRIGRIRPELRFEMVDWRQTKTFPEFCSQLDRAGDDNDAARKLIRSSADAAGEHVAKMLDSSVLFAQMIDEYHRETDPAALTAVRNRTAIPRDSALRILEDMYKLAARLYSHQRGIPKPVDLTDARNFYVFRYAVAMRLLALWWAKNGGISNTKPEKLKNDIADLEYAVCATYFDGLLTHDAKMQDIYEEAVYLLNEIFPKL
jgi:hypothetical protein